MHDEIISALKELEVRNGCKILFAAESGSRAWGFASPDSDYDVRAIYVKPLDWYLSIETAPKDTFEETLPGDLDIVAWELRKTLRLFAGCNLPLCEWLTSPILYYAVPGFLEEMLEFLPHAFNPVKATHHYLSLARQSRTTQAEDGTISLKKLCYLLRGLLAARWCCHFQTMPPVRFLDLLHPEILPDKLLPGIQHLLAQKHAVCESARQIFPAEMLDFYEVTMQECGRKSAELTPRLLPNVTLDNMLRKWVRGE